MKKLLLVLLAAPLLASAADESSVADVRVRPNIVLVVADDHAQWATAQWGQPVIRTPTLDELAKSGVRMLDATAVSPVCSPARASLLTGRLPSQHGVHDYIREGPGNERTWLQGETLLPELLQRAGYRTALIGKWHLGPGGTAPGRGFDRWLSYDVGPEGWRNQYRHRGVVHLSDDGKPVTVDGFQSARLVDAAIDWVSQTTDPRPFFLLLAPTDTHAPFEGQPTRWESRYRGPELLELVRTPPGLLAPAAETARAGDDLLAKLTQYLAAVSHQDAEIGRLVDALDACGVLDDTLVVYTSDQGLMLGQRGLIGKGNATLPQNLYEQSVRVPTVMRWPSRIPGRNRHAIPFDHIDLFHTLLDAAGAPLSGDLAARVNSPGASVLPYLKDTSTGWRAHRFAEYGTVRSVADRRYKLVVRTAPLPEGAGDELYDLVEDPGETRNLLSSPDHRRVERELRAVLAAHFGRYTVASRDGFGALGQPPQNGDEPWRRLAASDAPPPTPRPR